MTASPMADKRAPKRAVTMWAAYNRDGILFYVTIRYRRRDTIREAVQRRALPWPEMRRRGFTAQKVRITPIRRP